MKRWVAVMILVAACQGNDRGGRALGDSGLVINLPADWKIEATREGFDLVFDAKRKITITMRSDEQAKEVAQAINYCMQRAAEDPTPPGMAPVFSETRGLGDGRTYFRCGGKVLTLVPTQDGRIAECRKFDQDQPDPIATSACRSLRRK